MSGKKDANTLAAKDFEDAVAKLSEMVRKLEAGDLPLEESITCYEQGMALVESCRKTLSEAEQRIQLLTEAASGELKLQEADSDGEQVKPKEDKDEDEDGLPF